MTFFTLDRGFAWASRLSAWRLSQLSLHPEQFPLQLSLMVSTFLSQGFLL
jgi:hypothetical protein